MQVNSSKRRELQESSSSESSDSDSDSKSSSSDEPQPAVTGSRKLAPKTSKESDSDSDSDSDSESDAKPKLSAAKAKTHLESDKSSSSSSDSSDEEKDVVMTNESSTLATANKRKADAGATPPSKKPKLEANDSSNSTSTTIWVGNLSWNVDDDWLRTEFEGYGEVVSARVQMDRASGRSRGFGYVEFKDAAVAQAAVNDKSKEIDGRTPRIDIAPPRSAPDQTKRAKAFNDQKSEPSSILFVGNLSFDATEDGYVLFSCAHCDDG